jgi:hypothetical protein
LRTSGSTIEAASKMKMKFLPTPGKPYPSRSPGARFGSWRKHLPSMWPRKRPNCSQPSMGTFETAAMPLGTSANFRPRDGEVTGNLKYSGTM